MTMNRDCSWGAGTSLAPDGMYSTTEGEPELAICIHAAKHPDIHLPKELTLEVITTCCSMTSRLIRYRFPMTDGLRYETSISP